MYKNAITLRSVEWEKVPGGSQGRVARANIVCRCWTGRRWRSIINIALHAGGSSAGPGISYGVACGGLLHSHEASQSISGANGISCQRDLSRSSYDSTDSGLLRAAFPHLNRRTDQAPAVARSGFFPKNAAGAALFFRVSDGRAALCHRYDVILDGGRNNLSGIGITWINQRRRRKILIAWLRAYRAGPSCFQRQRSTILIVKPWFGGGSCPWKSRL